MNYDIFDRVAPAMPRPAKGTEIVKLLLSQASKDMREPLVPILFPILGAHISGTEFQYPDLSWKETCGMMANLVAESGGNKGQLSYLVEAIDNINSKESWSLRRDSFMLWPPACSTTVLFFDKPIARRLMPNR